MKAPLLKKFNDDEDKLIADYNTHAFFEALLGFSRQETFEFLIQKRYQAHYFTLLYDLAIDILPKSNTLKEALRDILREEYPPEEPSHREQLMTDLLKIGYTRKEILSPDETEATRGAYLELINLLKEFDEDRVELHVLTSIRLWGEILVSEEYSFIVKKLPQYGLRKGNSKFYWAHFEHDKKEKPLQEFVNNSEANTHSDQLSYELAKRIKSKSDITYAISISRKILEVKNHFYSQFL